MRPLWSFPVTFLLPSQSHCTHRSAKPPRSPSNPVACSVLPLQHSPDKPLAICSGLHRLFCSPPCPTAHTDQPIELAPLQAHPSALRSPCSTLWQPSSPLRAPLAALSGNHQPFSAVRTLRHEPLPPSFSLRSSRPSPNQWPRQLPSVGHRPRPTFPLMRVARPAPPYFSNTRTEHLFIRPARPRLDISPSS